MIGPFGWRRILVGSSSRLRLTPVWSPLPSQVMQLSTQAILSRIDSTIDESPASISRTLLHAVRHPAMLDHPQALTLHNHIHDYLGGVPSKVRRGLAIKHDPENQESSVAGPHEHIMGLQNHLAKLGYDSSIHRDYHYDIDDLVQMKHDTGWAPEDTSGPNSKLYIHHFTHHDYQRAAPPAQ